MTFSTLGIVWRVAALHQAVVDGDYCERFSQLPTEKQRDIAEELDRRPADILKKLEDTRNHIL